MPPSLVLVTDSQFRKAEAVFASARDVMCRPAPDDEAGLSKAIVESGARHAVVGHLRYEDALYRALPRGAVIARFGVGHDGIDKAKGTKAGLLCTNTPEVVNQSVAELTVLFMLAAARQFGSIAGGMQQGLWTPREGMELHGKTLAIIGYGRIGAATARIAARGFGMQVIGCNRSAPASGASVTDADVGAMTPDFASAVRDAHYVSVHIPATPENARFINRERLSMMRRDAWLINTARGAVVDEPALYDALSDGTIGGAALDVFDREPYQAADPGRDLRRLSNVILTPHIGTSTAEANRAMAERALHNIVLAEAGRFAEMDLLNPEVLRTV